MNDYFIWKGVKSLDKGVVASKLPPYTMAEERLEHIEVSGRAGSLTRKEGADIYNSMTVPVECFIRDDSAIAGLDAWLKGSGRIEFPNWPAGYYEAQIVNQIPLERILAGRAHRSFTVNFRLQPFRQSLAAKSRTLTEVAQYIENAGTIACAPVITVHGSGDIQLMVGLEIIELTGIGEGITIDCGMQEAYWGSTGMNNSMIGNYPLLQPGNTAISWTGSVTAVDITWREQSR